MERVPGSNITFLEMARRITNDGFCYLLPYVNNTGSGLTLRNERARVTETYSYFYEELGEEYSSLLWQLFNTRHVKLLTSGDFYQTIKAERQRPAGTPSEKVFCIGKKDSCNSYIDIVGDLAEHDERRRKSLKTSMREVHTCLKPGPMKRVRDFQKHRYGVAPVLLGFISSRRNLEKRSGTVEKLIDHKEAGQVNEQVDVMEDELFQLREIIAFRGTDSYSFNLLQVTKEYNIDQITTRTGIKGNFLIPSEENDEDNFITFVSDPRWKKGSMTFAHVLRNQQDKICECEDGCFTW